jgi:autotransporter translocation and assembly factor TamB
MHASLRREGDHWRVDATIRRASVVVPKQDSVPLHDAGPPPDMVIVRKDHPGERPRTSAASKVGTRPTRLDAVVHVKFRGVRIVTPEVRTFADGALEVDYGADGIVIAGQATARTGTIALFDRTYRVDRGVVAFDGPADPRLDVRLVHDFPDLTLAVEVGGRVSKPDIKLTSKPATYTEGQLLSILMGASPGLLPGQEARQAATGIASALASQKVQGVVGKYLPVRVDVLRFEASTAQSSAAFTIGKWVSTKLFVAFRRRLESRADENSGEAEVEYWLAPRVIVQGVAGDRGHHDADLLWVKRW